MEEETTTARGPLAVTDERADCTGGGGSPDFGSYSFLGPDLSLFLLLFGRSGTGSIPVRRLE